MQQPGQGPLEGIVIVDFTQYQQGTVATAMLADMGAEVIHVEARGKGDPGRALGGGDTPLVPYFECNNRGKKSITVDVRKEKGKEIIYKLVEKADVFAENFRVGVVQRLGIGYEDLKRINPKLIYLTASGFGLHGPSAEYPAFDAIGQAIGGIASVSGIEGSPMQTLGASVGDQTGGFMGAYAIMLGLFHRERTGEGQFIDVSLVGGQVALMGWQLASYLLTGIIPKRRRGRLLPGIVAGSFAGKDGKYFVVQATGRPAFERFYKGIGMESVLTDPRYDSFEKLRANMDALFGEMDKQFATKTRAEWLKVLRDEADIPSAPINDFAEVSVDPDVVANEYVMEIDHPKAGRVKVPGLPVNLSKTPGSVGIAPELGEHTDEILKSVGYSAADIERLRKEEVI